MTAPASVGLHVIARLPNGTTLVPDQEFVAVSRWSSRGRRYRYRGSVGQSARTGRRWVNAVDGRGLARAIWEDSITRVVPLPKEAP